MKFKIGDRVIVISYNAPGTVIEIDSEDSVTLICVEMDNPEQFAVKQLNMTPEELKRGLKAGKKPSVKMYTEPEDLRKISSSPEPD
jgi:uncharacterized protein YqfB (UPF0267 family)